MDTIRYWIWLQSALLQGSRKIRMIYTKYGSPKIFYDLGLREWKASGMFSAGEINRLKGTDISISDEIINECNNLNYKIITPDSSEYPLRLLNIPDYPAVIYVWGDIGRIDDEVAVTIVGTRSESPYGKKAAYNISLGLAKAGALVISGGAVGVDITSHKGALVGGGKTIAVLGCGINTKYLTENESLRQVISEHGAVISEYPPGTPVTKAAFPIRNRILSALSLGTVVVEAASRSGSLITANFAVEQGRDVFAVPGSIESEYSRGTNKLIQDGAKPVLCALDILMEYNGLYPHKLNLLIPEIFENKEQLKNIEEKLEQDFNISQIKKYINIKKELDKKEKIIKTKAKKIKAENTKPKDDSKCSILSDDILNSMSPLCKNIYKTLNKEPKHIDKIANEVYMPMNQVLGAITELELKQAIKSYAGRRFSR